VRLLRRADVRGHGTLPAVPPPTAVPADRPVLALDVGGTKLAAGLVAPDGTVVASARRPTPQPPATAEELWDAVTAVLDAVVARDEPIDGVGIGCGGPMRWPVGEVSPLNIPSWRDFPLRARLRERYAGRPVRLLNDALCLAAAEHWRGAAAGSRALLGMVVSTGVGGGLVLDGRLVSGPTGNAGHIGHVVVDPGGPACSCGGRGCLEAVASGPRLAAWAREQGWAPGGRTEHPERADAAALAADARAGHPVAQAAFERAGSAVGLALASTTHLCDLDVAVIGGGVAQAGDLLLAPLRASYDRHARMGFARRLDIRSASLGPATGLVGAAALVLAGERYWTGD
jgi:glucokinase